VAHKNIAQSSIKGKINALTDASNIKTFKGKYIICRCINIALVHQPLMISSFLKDK
jgi:hypothetical protein